MHHDVICDMFSGISGVEDVGLLGSNIVERGTQSSLKVSVRLVR